jgi:hypothetical protein
MTRFLDLKGVGYGLAAFFAGYVVLALLGVGADALGKTSFARPAWLLFQSYGYVLPVMAGYYAAYRASHHRIATGTVGGALGMAFLVAPAMLIPQYPVSGVPAVLASSLLLAALGAIIGKFRGPSVGP